MLLSDNEVEVEKMAKKITDGKSEVKFPPVFEMFVTIFSLFMCIMLFLFSDMLHTEDREVYTVMLKVMSQPMWAFAFLISSLTKAAGLLMNKNWMRIIGLIFSCIIYASFTMSYAVVFPSVGAVVFVCMTMFTVVSIAMINQTEIGD